MNLQQLSDGLNQIEIFTSNLTPDEKNHKLILEKMIDISLQINEAFNRELKFTHTNEKFDKFDINFNTDLIKNCLNLTEQNVIKETTTLEKSAKFKALENKKNEIINIETTEISIINSLINSEKDKEIYLEEKMKERHSHEQENQMKKKNIASEIQKQELILKQFIAELDKGSKENKIIFENVNIFIY